MKNSYTLKEIIFGLRDNYLTNHNLSFNHNITYLLIDEIISIYGNWCKRIFVYNNKLEIKLYNEFGQYLDKFNITYDAINDKLIFNLHIKNKAYYISHDSKLIDILLNKKLIKTKIPTNYRNIIDNSENAKKQIYIDKSLHSYDKTISYLINDEINDKKIKLIKKSNL